jgi:Spy/CpxP family protein refolding chaperone
MRHALLLGLALTLGPGALVAQGPPGGREGQRRMELEQRVRRQFLSQVARRLELTTTQREQVREILRGGAEERRDLALESQALRIDLMQAVRDEDTPPARYEELLQGIQSLRQREQGLEVREEEALARVLDPRQRALFLMMRMQFNDRVRQLRGPGMRGPGGGGPGGRGSGGGSDGGSGDPA